MNGDSDARTSNEQSQLPPQSVALIRSTLEDMRRNGLKSGLPQEHAFTLLEEIERLRRERDEAREHTSTAAFMRLEAERDEWARKWHRVRAELAELKYPGMKGIVRPLSDEPNSAPETSEQRYWHECPHMAGYVPKDYECALCSALGGSR